MKETRQERRARERAEARARQKAEARGPVNIDAGESAPSRAFWGKLALVVAGACLLAWPLLKGRSGGDDAVNDGLREGLESLEERVQDAIAGGRRGVRAEPDSSAAWGRLGALLDAHGLDEEALDAYARARELDGSEFRWWYLPATVAQRRGETAEEVERLFAGAVALDEDYPHLYWRRGNARFLLGNLEDARSDLARALALDPELGHAHRDLGSLRLAEGNASGALEAFRAAERSLPNDAAVHSGLARAFAMLDRTADSEAATARAAECTPAGDAPDPVRLEVEALGVSSALASSRADALFQAGEFERALEQLAIVESARPDDARVQVRIGLCRQRLGRLTPARQAFSRAVELDPELVEAHRELARVVGEAGDGRRALEHFARALELAPNDGVTHAKRGLTLHRMGRLDDALEAFARAEAADGLAADDWVNWAVALTGAERYDDARARLESALELDPRQPRALFGLGFIAERQERPAEAVSAYGRAVEADPDYGDAHLNLGLVHERLGAIGPALTHLRRAQQLAPRAETEARIRRLEESESQRHAGGGGVDGAREEFLALAKSLADSDQKYLGRADYEQLQRALEAPGLAASQRVDLLARLAREALELGEVDEAVAAVEEQARWIETLPGRSLRPEDVRLAALTYLRQAELQNCILRHNQECCIFPLEGGGVHIEREPARRALEAYRRYLELEPGDLGARWLLNVAAMALGEHPAAVPEALRLDRELFRSEADVPRFRDVGPALGVARFNLCGGTVVDDMDGDGRLDIVTSSYDPEVPLAYFWNDGRGGFEDRSEASGLSGQLGGLNVIGADADGDGDLDLLVLRGAWLLDHGRMRNSLLLNDGQGNFTDATRRSGLAFPAAPTQAACFADFDSDGDLDIYIANESRAAFESTGHYPSQLFMRSRKGEYKDFAGPAGVTNDRYAKGVCAGDMDGDADLDLYVSNNGPNRLYENHGDQGFVDVAPERGVDGPTGRSFACWFFDYDNDGDLDLFVGGFQANIADLCAAALDQPDRASRPRLYRGDGAGNFEDVAAEVGLDGVYLPMGANFGDVDGDGFEDIYLATGDPDFETLMPNVLLKNEGGERFVDATTASGLGHLQKGHGVAFADIDQDGDLDLYHQLGGFYPGDAFANALFENPGPASTFLVLELVGEETNRQGIGVRIEVRVRTADGERSIHRAAGSVSSFGGSPRRQWIGLGDAQEVLGVTVRWPEGTIQNFGNVRLNTRLRITEDQPVPEELSYPLVRLGSR